MDEQWRDIPGWVGVYQVSDTGRVRSMARVVAGGPVGRRNWPERELAPSPNSSGYPSVVLMAQGRKRTARVHQLVAEAFIGPRQPGLEVRHLDGQPLNNNLENLAYGTRAENDQDRIRHGVTNRGSRHPMVKLTENQVREIRQLIRDGMSQERIGKRFGVSQTAIHHIFVGNSWAWLDAEAEAA